MKPFYIPIPPASKAPGNGWNKPQSKNNPGGYTDSIDSFKPGWNVGLFHQASGTLSLDLDNLNLSHKVFEELADDTTLTDWLKNPDRVEIKSPKPNRGKLIFKLPDGCKTTGAKQFKHDNKTIFELRSGSCQDVVHGEHPEGGRYVLIGDLNNIPPIPEILLDMLINWDAWKPCFDSVLGVEQEPPEIRTHKPQQGETLLGWRNPIKEFNQANGVAEILKRNGYQPKGPDRFIRPGSESKAPGAVIMRNCSDGIERVYSHGGDVLNDGFAHDAFDAFRLLECNGDYKTALNWNTEITKANQRLYMQNTNNGNGAKLVDDLLKPQNKPTEPQNEQSNTSQPQTEKTSKTGFSFVSADQLTLQPKPVKWLIKNYIEQDSLNLLFAEPGSGKSLLSLEWAFCITNGISWNGQTVQAGKVAYICGEGFSGLGKRLKALEQKYEMPVSENLLISQTQMDLVNAVSAAGVADAIKAAGGVDLIIVDTLHRNMLADENSSADMAKVIANIDNHLKVDGAAVLLVHHTGHGAKDRSRGSSSIRASMDAEFSLSKDDKQITLSCTKSKDFEPPEPAYFEQTTVFLDGWADDEGQPLTSALLQASDKSVQIRTKTKSLTPNQQNCFDALAVVLEDVGREASPELLQQLGDAFKPGLRVCHVEQYRAECYRRIEVKPNADKNKEQNSKYQSWRRIVDTLKKRNLIRIYDDNVFYIHEPIDSKLEKFYENLG